jgi:hypothetical protein
LRGGIVGDATPGKHPGEDIGMTMRLRDCQRASLAR